MPLSSDEYNSVIRAIESIGPVRALAIGGSRGRGTADKESDYDFFAFSYKEYEGCLYDIIRSTIYDCVDIVTIVDRGFVEDMGYLYQFVLYDLSLIDISIIYTDGKETYNILRSMKMIFDKDGMATIICNNSKDYTEIHDSNRNNLLTEYNGLLISFLASAIKASKRENVWLLMYYVERIRNTIFSLIRLSVRSYTPFIRRGEDKIEELIDKEIESILENYDARADLKVLRRTIVLLVDTVLAMNIEQADICLLRRFRDEFSYIV